MQLVTPRHRFCEKVPVSKVTSFCFMALREEKEAIFWQLEYLYGITGYMTRERDCLSLDWFFSFLLITAFGCSSSAPVFGQQSSGGGLFGQVWTHEWVLSIEQPVNSIVVFLFFWTRHTSNFYLAATVSIWWEFVWFKFSQHSRLSC